MSRRPGPPRRGGARQLAALLALALAACGPSDVARRPLREEWPGGGLKCEGSEVRVGGRWVKDGPATFHRQDGSLAARGGYERGLESGAWSEWLEDGTRAEGAYLEGRREGPWVYWHPEGTRQEEGAYAAGLREGRWRWWYPDGSLRGEAEYAGGRMHGRVVEYRRDGSVDPEASGTYVEGEKVAD